MRQIATLEQAFRTLGSGLERPFLTLQTFCFTGLPFFRLTDKGLADVREKKLVNLFLENKNLKKGTHRSFEKHSPPNRLEPRGISLP